jgi:hypothetical protein
VGWRRARGEASQRTAAVRWLVWCLEDAVGEVKIGRGLTQI